MYLQSKIKKNVDMYKLQILQKNSYIVEFNYLKRDSN